MLVWVVLHEVLRISSDGVVLDKLVGVASVHKSFEDALKFCDKMNGKLLDKGTKSVKMLNGEIVCADYYINKDGLYLLD